MATETKSSATTEIKFRDQENDEVYMKLDNGKIKEYVNGELITEDMKFFELNLASRQYRDSEGIGTFKPDEDLDAIVRKRDLLFQVNLDMESKLESSGSPWLRKSPRLDFPDKELEWKRDVSTTSTSSCPGSYPAWSRGVTPDDVNPAWSRGVTPDDVNPAWSRDVTPADDVSMCMMNTRMVEIGMRTVVVEAADDIDLDAAVAAQPFIEWKNRIELEDQFTVEKITIQSLDKFGPRIGFLKIKAITKVDGKQVPGIVFMRGGSVAILVLLECEGKLYTVLVHQPRVAIGQRSFPEIPAGMLDGNGNFAGVAAKELKEETGIEIDESNLYDLTGAVYGAKFPGMYR